ncbi:uncharacterized protein BJ171DRAFT_533803 [Polychytrium aggregatum]|uniref:uncharacterized protein n=1 Tax=Polychytrium aggregatum TaxID=110093 RepID=UPI0022FEAAC2|nr:uncharacterized protein BJ171DRAFT_533803 [Polychytrium aggregatum]KAI9193114.1 hypothetical protein BJ171DRAFT_533803 [Polychytrium aggregatum]
MTDKPGKFAWGWAALAGHGPCDTLVAAREAMSLPPSALGRCSESVLVGYPAERGSGWRSTWALARSSTAIDRRQEGQCPSTQCPLAIASLRRRRTAAWPMRLICVVGCTGLPPPQFHSRVASRESENLSPDPLGRWLLEGRPTTTEAVLLFCSGRAH